MRFGAHMSTSGGIWKALERGTRISCDIVQVFVKNNMQWFGKPYPPRDIEQFRAQRQTSNLHAIFGHAGYLINLAAPPSDNRDKSIKSLIQEVELATSIEVPFLVLHPGAHLGGGEEAGLDWVVNGLNQVFQATSNSQVRIALENTAGQGSCLGCRLQHLAAIYDRVDRPKRLGICLDTAHLLAAGYDIRTPKGWDAAMDEIERAAGLDQILAFHLNDSKTELGSRVDRHAHIGEGKIGLEAFRYIVNDPRFKIHPGCLETPKSDDLHEDVANLKVLRSLLAGSLKRSKAKSSHNKRSRLKPTTEARPTQRGRRFCRIVAP
jgi:deoxyribonuclease-4